jgi:hypothetical protein
MTSEVEHDILVGAEGAWSHATAAGQPPGGAAAAEAAAAAARAALSSAQAQIEELLDDKADLEYEVDVVERKVELLREEVRCCVLVDSLRKGMALSWRRSSIAVVACCCLAHAAVSGGLGLYLGTQFMRPPAQWPDFLEMLVLC